MQTEPANNGTFDNESDTSSADATGKGLSPPGGDSPQETPQPGDENTQAAPDKADDDNGNRLGKQSPTATGEQKENKVNLLLEKSQAGLISTLSGDGLKVQYGDAYYNQLPPIDAPKNLELFITEVQLQPPARAYKSLDSSKSAGYTGALLSHRILLLSCYDDDVALNIAKSIAYQNRVASKHLVTLEKNCQGSYTIDNLIQGLASLKENGEQFERRPSQHLLPAIWVWWANDISDGDLSDTILDSLFAGSARLEQYQTRLADHASFLICLVPPHKVQNSRHSRFEAFLQNWREDFLRPLLEEYELSQYEELAETITRQRQQKLWSENHDEFYKEICRYLREKNLPTIVADRPQQGYCDNLEPQQLFNRQDPLIDTVLYCATYFPDLSPQDFSYLVELFIGDATEEVTRKIEPAQTQNEKEIVDFVEAAPLVRRWQRETDAVLRTSKLVALKNENNERVVDFQVDGLRNRLSQYIQNDHYFFYESNFLLVRRQGLLFSSRKKIAEGARQLLVEMAGQYAPSEVANWLFEIVTAFERMTRDESDLPRERSPVFSLLPHGKVRTARHLVCQGLSLVLTRLNKEPELAEGVRLFWQKLLQTHHQWFLDLLRRTGNFPPTEILQWLKQLLDQGSEEIRIQVCGYLVGYLLRREALIYETLNEFMHWPGTSQAGRSAQMLLILYCTETNRRLAQKNYGQWPSLHPLFGFQDRDQASECIDLLIGWLFTAAVEIHQAEAPVVVADVLAGWYFILSPPSHPDCPDKAIAIESVAELDALTVRELLLKRLAQYISRQQKNSLLTIWDSFKSNIQEEVFQLDEFTNQIAGFLLNTKLMNDAKTARKKLLDTRTLLSQLRKDLIRCAAVVTQS
jgi:hypothetical protein